MANTILTPTAVTREILRVLHNNLAFTRNVDRQYDNSFAQSGAKIGTQLKIRLPNQYTVRTGAGLSAQNTSETSVTLTVATQKGVDMNFSTQELTMSMQDFSKRVIEPAAKRLASEIDKDGLALYADVYNNVGTPGTTPAAALVLLQAQARMSEFATPLDSRSFVCNPIANATLVNGLTLFFNPQGAISEQYKSGRMGLNVLGYDEIAMDQNIPSLTVGSRSGSPLVAAVPASGDTTLSINSLGAAVQTVAAGDTFTIGSVFAVNPETKISTGNLQQFVVTAAATSAASAIAALAISPAMITTGATQTIDSLPQIGAAVTFSGTASTAYPQNLAYHREAFTLATADLEIPNGVHFAARENVDGISIRIVRQYDINNDNIPCRLDVLYGWKTLRASMACRVWG